MVGRGKKRREGKRVKASKVWRRFCENSSSLDTLRIEKWPRGRALDLAGHGSAIRENA